MLPIGPLPWMKELETCQKFPVIARAAPVWVARATDADIPPGHRPTERAMPHLDFYDYLTFASIFAVTLGGLGAMVLIFSLPGKIALKRKHPEAEAVNLMGWAGFIAVVPWMRAFIWAFKPTDVVDIRYLPADTARETAREVARVSGKSPPDEPVASPVAPPAPPPTA